MGDCGAVTVGAARYAECAVRPASRCSTWTWTRRAVQCCATHAHALSSTRGPTDELFKSEQVDLEMSTHLARCMSVEHAAHFLAGPFLRTTLRALATRTGGRDAVWLLERLHEAFKGG